MRTPSLHFNFSLLLVVKHYGACIIYNRLVRFEYQESHKYSADLISAQYSIVKGSSADLGVNSKIVQIRPTVKAVSTKISKKNFLHNSQYIDVSERK